MQRAFSNEKLQEASRWISVAGAIAAEVASIMGQLVAAGTAGGAGVASAVFLWLFILFCVLVLCLALFRVSAICDFVDEYLPFFVAPIWQGVFVIVLSCYNYTTFGGGAIQIVTGVFSLVGIVCGVIVLLCGVFGT